MEADPASVLPAVLMRESYLEMAADPVLRALYLGDAEVLGRLAHEAATTLRELTERRSEAFREPVRRLQAAGCLRGDLPAEALQYTVTAIVMGFYTVEGMQLPGPGPDVTDKAALLEQAVAAAVQVPDPPAAELERLAPAIAQLYRPLIEHIDHEWRRRVR